MKKIILLKIIVLFFFGCQIKENKNNLFLTIDLIPLFSFYDENKNLTGFDIELSKLICQQIKMKCIFNILDTKEIFASIENNINDIGIHIVKSKKREENFTFSIPYRYEPIGILKWNENSIEKIAITISGFESFYVEKFFPKEKIIYFDNVSQKFQAFKSKNVDAIGSSFFLIQLYLKENKFKDKVFVDKIENQNLGFYFIMKKNNFLLKEKIDSAINELTKNGMIKKLEEKYHLN